MRGDCLRWTLLWRHHLFVGQISERLLVTGTLLDVGDIRVKSSILIN